MNTPKAYIKHISYYLPEFELTNKILNEEFPEWSIDKISEKTGIYCRHIARSDEFASDMAVNVAEQLFAEHSIDKGSIDYLLFCTQSPDYFLPTTACLLQQRLGLHKTIGAIDFNLGCSGFVYGLGLAKGLIVSEQAKNVLLITAETYSKFIHPKDKSNKTIFGDGAAATLISAVDGFAEILNFEYGTDGQGGKNLIVKNGGVRNRFADVTDEVTDEFGNVYCDDNLYMNGPEIFNFTSSVIPKLVENTLLKNEVSPNDIQLFILHQANKYVLTHLEKKMKIAAQKSFKFLSDCGNTVSSTVPIALCEAKKMAAFNHGDNILLAGFGVGYSWAACVVRAQLPQ